MSSSRDFSSWAKPSWKVTSAKPNKFTQSVLYKEFWFEPGFSSFILQYALLTIKGFLDYYVELENYDQTFHGYNLWQRIENKNYDDCKFYDR